MSLKKTLELNFGPFGFMPWDTVYYNFTLYDKTVKLTNLIAIFTGDLIFPTNTFEFDLFNLGVDQEKRICVSRFTISEQNLGQLSEIKKNKIVELPIYFDMIEKGSIFELGLGAYFLPGLMGDINLTFEIEPY
jgi:hypothetical protein